MNGHDPTTLAVWLRNVSFRYEGASAPALEHVELAVPRGTLTVVCGASGAGKTTLTRILHRAIPSFYAGELSGEVWLLGERCEQQGVADFAGRIGVVAQDFEAQLFSTSVLAELAFGLEQLGVPSEQIEARVAAALQAVGLNGFGERDPATLSGGEKQRLAIAALLALEPELLVLDEPTTDLDPLGKEEVLAVLRALRARGQTLVVVEHESRALEMADQVVVLRAGKVAAAAPPAEILRKPEVLLENAVRPPDLALLARRLGLATVPRSVDEADETLGRPRRSLPPSTLAAQRTEPVLVAHALRFVYPEASEPALRDVSLSVAPGEFVALLGQNGSGKTTLARCLVGLLKPQRGEVILAGRTLHQWPAREVARRVGYVFQNPDHQIFTARVAEEIAFGPRQLGLGENEVQERVAEALKAVGLTGREEADPFWLGKNERQRLAVAAVLAMRPEVVILDEPTTGLDQQEQKGALELIERLRAEGVAVVMITHNPWLVIEGAERCVLLSAGEVIFDGPLPQLLRAPHLLARARFRVPPLVELASRCGIVARSVEEFVAALRGTEEG